MREHHNDDIDDRVDLRVSLSPELVAMARQRAQAAGKPFGPWLTATVERAIHNAPSGSRRAVSPTRRRGRR